MIPDISKFYLFESVDTYDCYRRIIVQSSSSRLLDDEKVMEHQQLLELRFARWLNIDFSIIIDVLQAFVRIIKKLTFIVSYFIPTVMGTFSVFILIRIFSN